MLTRWALIPCLAEPCCGFACIAWCQPLHGAALCCHPLGNAVYACGWHTLAPDTCNSRLQQTARASWSRVHSNSALQYLQQRYTGKDRTIQKQDRMIQTQDRTVSGIASPDFSCQRCRKHVCFTDVMNRSPTKGKNNKKTALHIQTAPGAGVYQP